MTCQLALFDAPRVAAVRRTDPRTAKDAAAMNPEGRNHQRTIILNHLRHHGPATADECARLIGRHRSIASSRLGVLVNAGLVEVCGVADDADEHGRVRSVQLYRAVRT